MIAAVAEIARRARRRADEARAQAEAASRAKSVFLANMSHELRTPLNAIMGFSRLLRADPAMPAEQRGTLDIINRSGEHLLALINNVLDMAKIEAGRDAVNLAPCDLAALLREGVNLLRQRAEAAGLSLRLELADDLPAYVQTDAAKLRQILVNLLGNAVKFTPHGGVTVRARCGSLDAGRRTLLTLEVEDTGPGIPAAERERIFEPFVQLGTPVGQKGTGLGLAITRQFAHVLGGKVSASGAVEQGALLRVELPVAVAVAPPLPVPDGGQLQRLAPGQGEVRVLVVEDQAENWQLLQRLLVGAGCVVQVAENGARGVELFQSWGPQFIWMDWRMPVMDGVEATRRIRQLPGGRQVKIAVASASVFEAEREQVIAAGADAFVAKPLQFPQVFACMSRLLEVRFVSADPEPEALAEPAGELDPAALAALPAELRQALAEGLVALDAEQIRTAIDRIGVWSEPLGRALRACADQLRYTQIRRALEPAGEGRP
jgi:CheY-like chemotaxis protein/nitrogen-specific signal transduction histidine kinase